MKKRPIVKGNNEKGNKKIRIRVDKDELDHINELRTLWNEAVDSGINPTEVKHGWIKNEGASLFMKNHAYKEPEQHKLEKTFEKLLEELKDYSPKYPIIQRKKSNDGHLLVVDPADVHIGKLCKAFETREEYNEQIAVKRVKEGINGLLNKSQGFDIDKILLVIGNDILHTDTPKRTTTSGTPQDTDGMWYDNFNTAVRLYIDIIETLVTIADVHVVFNPSNHDYMSGFFTAQLIETHFRLSKNITFNCDISHRKYFTYGSNLIGTTHGDGAKTADLPQLMAHESEDWTNCKHRYIYTHHLHHKVSKDYMSVCVETLRSPSGTDSWHHRNGYQHAPKAIEAFLHHPIHGQIARFTHLF
jgi:hypothetical protein